MYNSNIYQKQAVLNKFELYQLEIMQMLKCMPVQTIKCCLLIHSNTILYVPASGVV